MKRIAVLTIAIFVGCVHPDVIPHLGDLYHLRSSDQRLVVASAQIWPYEEAMFDGFKFQVAVDDRGKIAYLSTQDPKFKTPEGISMSSTLEDVLKTGAKHPWKERGWAFHTELPSGWSVAFTNGLMLTEGDLKPGAKVAWIFKRR